MLKHLQQNSQFYLILIIWLIVGLFLGPIVYIIVPITLILLERRGFYKELFIGFLFILIVADNLLPGMEFAGKVKTIYLLLLTYFLFRNNDSFVSLNQIFRIFTPFFLFAIFCLVYSPVIFVGAQKTLSYALVILVVPNYFIKCYNDKGEEFIRDLLFFGATILMAGFFFIPFGNQIAFMESGRFRGVFGNPNGIGLFCFVFSALYATVINIFPKLFTKKEKIAVVALIVSTLLLCRSRNALFGCLILLIFERFFKKAPLLGFVFLMIMLFIDTLLVDQLPYIITQLGLEDFLRLNTITELSGRSIAWRFAWGKILDNLYVGLGFGYDESLMRQHYYELSRLGHEGGVHNSYLSIWLNFGLIGLIIYFRSFLLLFIKASKTNNLALPIMYSIFFSATFEGLLIGSLNPHMFILLIVLTLICEDAWKSDSKTEQMSVVTSEF